MTLITTPTGNIGSKVLAALLPSDEPLRILARTPGKLSAEAREEAVVIEGSLDNPTDVARALRGSKQLFLIIPPSTTYDNVDEYYLGYSKIICAAILREGVKRVVYVSGTGLGFDKNAGPVSASFLVEERLKATGVNLRLLHCGTFMENLFHSLMPIKMAARFGTTVPADVQAPWVATQDIADVAVRLLLDPDWKGQDSVGILGPKDLSYGEIALVMSEVLKKQITYAPVPEEAFKATLEQYGASEAAAQGLVDIYSSMTRGLFNRVPRTAATSSPTTFRDWCEKVFKPLVTG